MPKGMDNSTLILDAARQLFLEHGFAATSMDVVAQLAGVSKATVYARFESKEQLFAAMIEREGHQQLVMLEADPDIPIEVVMHTFGKDAAALLLSPVNVAMTRIVASEATRSPEIGQLFYANGPAKLIARLASFIGTAMGHGQLRVASAELAAAQFLAVIVADLQLRLAMGFEPPTTSEQNEIVATGVEVFLRGYAA
jgi:TetR/AcrR family transcriptional regulator, mexJK operon transcriptional repressor